MHRGELSLRLGMIWRRCIVARVRRQKAGVGLVDCSGRYMVTLRCSRTIHNIVDFELLFFFFFLSNSTVHSSLHNAQSSYFVYGLPRLPWHGKQAFKTWALRRWFLAIRRRGRWFPTRCNIAITVFRQSWFRIETDHQSRGCWNWFVEGRLLRLLFRMF